MDREEIINELRTWDIDDLETLKEDIDAIIQEQNEEKAL